MLLDEQVQGRGRNVDLVQPLELLRLDGHGLAQILEPFHLNLQLLRHLGERPRDLDVDGADALQDALHGQPLHGLPHLGLLEPDDLLRLGACPRIR